jgi:type III secretion protein L
VVAYYRLKTLGYELAAGTHVVRAADFAPVDAATKIIEDAEAEAERIREEAREAFRQEKIRGWEEGLEQARMAAVGRMLEESKALDDSLKAIERDLTGVVVHSMRKLVDGFSDVEKAEAVVRSALKQMRREKRIQLAVAPSQFQHFRTVIADIVRGFPEIDLVDVVEDASLDAPRVIVESSIGRVDGNFGQRVEDVEIILRRSVAALQGEAVEEAAR